MKKILQGFLCTLIILLMAGCGEVPKLANGEDALLSFENKELNISVNDLYNSLKNKYGTGLMVEMIDTKILNLKYPTDDDATLYVENQVETYETYYGGREKLLETLQNYGYESITEFETNLLLEYKRNLALKEYVRSNIKDSEIEKYYKNNVFGDITASHILITVDTTDTMTDEEKREAEKKATTTIEEIYKKLSDGEDFHELAKVYSKDSSNASNGGRLKSFNFGEMEKEFETAAKNLTVGKYNSKAVKTRYGYHIIYKEAEKSKPELITIKQTIIDKLVNEEISNDSKLQYKALIELRKSYGLKINDDDLNSYYENAVNNWLYSKED